MQPMSETMYSESHRELFMSTSPPQVICPRCQIRLASQSRHQFEWYSTQMQHQMLHLDSVSGVILTAEGAR